MKLISSGKETEFMKKIVLPSSPGGNEDKDPLMSQGNQLSQGTKDSRSGVSPRAAGNKNKLSNMYVSKSLNTPRQQKKPAIPESTTPKSKGKKGKLPSMVTQNEASGANTGAMDQTAVFFISPASDVKEEVLRYYDIDKQRISPTIAKMVSNQPNSSNTYKS